MHELLCLVVVNVNVTKCVAKCKKNQMCSHQMCSFKLQMHQNPFSAGAPPFALLGELTTAYFAYRPLDGWGRNNPSYLLS